MPNDTARILGENARNCDCRSLLLDRFADPSAKEKDRHEVFARAFKATASKVKTGAWVGSLASGSGVHPGVILYAQLQSRLMVNMAGGVMENAGLLLDRFGLPYLPGSAVKGCARRAAIAALREWCETGQKPGATEADKDNLFKTGCEPFDTPAAMLAAIARVFGWCEQDWSSAKKDGRYVADFAWACSGASDAAAPTERNRSAQGNALGAGPAANLSPEGAADAWPAIRDKAIRQLATELRVPIPEDEPQPAKRLPNFAGGVSFLPAYPVDLGKPSPMDGLLLPVPELGKLELDVVTCHHRDYYGGKLPVATDTEEPVPVVFPAAAAGHVFTFELQPLRGADSGVVTRSATWLATGLQTFGLGAKTAAGYGWFQDVTQSVRSAQKAAEDAQQERETQAREQAVREAARSNLQPDPAFLEKLGTMKEPDLRGQINPFATEERFWSQKDERLQLTLLHFLLIATPAILAADRGNPKSKVAKAIANLSAKFPHVAPSQP